MNWVVSSIQPVSSTAPAGRNISQDERAWSAPAASAAPCVDPSKPMKRQPATSATRSMTPLRVPSTSSTSRTMPAAAPGTSAARVATAVCSTPSVGMMTLNMIAASMGENVPCCHAVINTRHLGVQLFGVALVFDGKPCNRADQPWAGFAESIGCRGPPEAAQDMHMNADQPSAGTMPASPEQDVTRQAVTRPDAAKQDAAPTLRIRAVMLGERINASGLELGALVSSTPAAFRVHAGLVVVFRYGVVVLIGLLPSEEKVLIDGLKSRVTGEFSPYEEEIAQA